MSQNSPDTKLSSLEAAVLRNLRQMDLRACDDMLNMSTILTEAYPVRPMRPALHLVKAENPR